MNQTTQEVTERKVKPRRRYRRWIAVISVTAIAILVASIFLGFWPRSLSMQDPWDAIPKATPEQIAKLHEPEALRADLDAIVALHERTNPNPYLRVSKESILALAERLKASIDRPMTRREFLPIVMEMQAGYRSDHYGQGVRWEDFAAAFAAGERLLPFRAAPEGDGLVVVAVAESERAIEPGDRIVRIGTVTAAEHLARLRSLQPGESERWRDVCVRKYFRANSWVVGIKLPTEVELIRPDASRQVVTVEGVGDDARKTERTAAGDAPPTTPAVPQGKTLVDSPPFRCMLLPSEPPDAAPIALIDFPTMDSTLGGQWDTFLDQAIAAANARGAAGLIVDIRKNGGGSTDLGYALLARVTDRPYRMSSRLVWRRSEESDELFRMKAKPMWRWLTIVLPIFMPEYTKLKHGEDLTYEFEATSRPRVEPGFDGPSCLLIGDQTFSAAVALADGMRTYDLMLTIGQPTGGVPNTLGDIGPFQLPNSGIVVNFSQKMFIRASGDETDVGSVRPHIEVAPIPGRDATLERAVEEIRKMPAERKK
ncbi:MAG: S41 family peptidase [Pirellulaceae bacterium]